MPVPSACVYTSACCIATYGAQTVRFGTASTRRNAMFDAECESPVPENQTLGASPSLLLRLQPVVSNTYIDDQGNRKHRRMLHFLADEAGHHLELGRWGFEHELIVYLQ